MNSRIRVWSGMCFKCIGRVGGLLVMAGIERLKSVSFWLFNIDGRWGFALKLLFCSEGNPWSEKRITDKGVVLMERKKVQE